MIKGAGCINTAPLFIIASVKFFSYGQDRPLRKQEPLHFLSVIFLVFQGDVAMNAGLMFALAAAVLALLYGMMSIKWILGLPTGNKRMQEIAAAKAHRPT